MGHYVRVTEFRSISIESDVLSEKTMANHSCWQLCQRENLRRRPVPLESNVSKTDGINKMIALSDQVETWSRSNVDDGWKGD